MSSDFCSWERKYLIHKIGKCSVDSCTITAIEQLKMHHVIFNKDGSVPESIRRTVGWNGEVVCKKCEKFAHRHMLLSGCSIRSYFRILTVFQENGWITKKFQERDSFAAGIFLSLQKLLSYYRQDSQVSFSKQISGTLNGLALPEIHHEYLPLFAPDTYWWHEAAAE